MEVGPRALGQGVVGGVADQLVMEAVAVAVAFDQAFAHQFGERRVDRRFAQQRADVLAPERLALDGGRAQQRALGGLEPVQPRGQQRLDRGRHLRQRLALVVDHRHQLGDEQRVALRHLEDAPADVGADRRGAGEPVQELARVPGGERVEHERVRPPGRAVVEQLRPGGPEQQQRRVAHRLGQVVEEVQEGLVGPLQVVDGQDERPPAREALEHHPQHPLGLVRGHGPSARVQQLGGPRQCRMVVSELVDQPAQRLHERPPGQRLPVGQATAEGHGGAIGEPFGDLRDQPRLADPGGADDRAQLARARAPGAFEHPHDPRTLVVAVDERRARALRTHRRGGGDVQQPVGGDRVAPALDLERAERLGHDGVGDQPVGPGAEQDLPRPRGLLEPRGHVDGVAGGERADVGRAARCGLARVEPDAHAQLDADLGVEPVTGRAHVQRRPRRPQGVVLVRCRDAEDGHHAVTPVVLDRAAVALDRAAHGMEPALHRPPQLLRVDALAERGRAHHVGEDHAQDLAALLDRHGRAQPRAALGAEPRAVRRPLPAAHALLHGATLGGQSPQQFFWLYSAV